MTGPSGQTSPTRFFSFRWLYLILAAFLWAFLISLCYFELDYDVWWSPAFLLLFLLSEIGFQVEASGMHGVFGFNLYEHWWTPQSYVIDPMLAAPLLLTVFLIAATAAFVVPESGKTRNLPATRGVHPRAKLTASLVIGMAMTALAAGFLDVSGVDLKPVFEDLGWISQPGIGMGWYYNPSSSLTYYPDSGLAKPVSWISALAGTVVFGTLAWVMLSYVRPGRDRYWQAERWTLLLTLFSFALCCFGLFGMGITQGSYYDLDYFLGGCYTTFLIGFAVLTWSWSCRACLLFMCMRYEKASMDTDDPICFACGYDLRMLASDKCPECGAGVRPAVLARIRSSPHRATNDHAESRSTTR